MKSIECAACKAVVQTAFDSNNRLSAVGAEIPFREN